MIRFLISILGKNDTRWLLSLSLKHRLYILYFLVSFCSLCITDENSLWVIVLVVLNFGNAARLIMKVPLPESV